MTTLVSDTTFDEEVLQSKEPVLVDFFAEWCGPCKAMAPALEQVASEQKGKVKVVKLDVDQSPAITTRYGIRAMPTLIVFKDGKVAGQHVGALVQKRKLEEWIGSQIGESLVAKA
ncbi:MAG: thioredoxin [Hyphomicrobium sp.]|uniref:thioredoxin n=1 Tax=Hyphomicrobium sp. TaxID=82 RepID=UPI003D0B0310